MTIRSLVLNVTDVARSVDFYARHLGAEPLEVGPDSAVLDLVTATMRLCRVDGDEPSTWVPDDLQAGFRHVGLKVADLDTRVAALVADGVPFHLDPIDAAGEVRITFFYDPDGTLLEMVQGPLRYHEIHDRAEVERDWALGTPTRPRFDHVAETVADRRRTEDHFAPQGFTLMGGIHQPDDTRGFDIAYLHGGDTTLEIFTFDRAVTLDRTPQLEAPGFVAVVLDDRGPTGPVPAAPVVGSTAGLHLVADPDGLVYARGAENACAGA